MKALRSFSFEIDFAVLNKCKESKLFLYRFSKKQIQPKNPIDGWKYSCIEISKFFRKQIAVKSVR